MLKTITIPKNTELNYGDHEDSDSVITKKRISALVVGITPLGSMLVKIIENGLPSNETFHFHQPERGK